MSCENDSHLLFVYGTLKSGQPNHFYIQDEENGKAKLLALAKTSEKYPLVVATEYNIPFLLAKQGSGHVSTCNYWLILHVNRAMTNMT